MKLRFTRISVEDYTKTSEGTDGDASAYEAHRQPPKVFQRFIKGEENHSRRAVVYK